MCLSVLFVPAFATGQSNQGQSDKGEIFVNDIEDSTRAIDPALMKFFSEVVRDGARKYATGYRLLDRENAEAILGGFKIDLKDCELAGRNDCEVDFGRRLQAEVVVSGQILMLQTGSARIVLKMFGTANSESLSSAMGTAASVDQIELVLLDMMPKLFRPLFRPDAGVQDVELPPPDPNAGYGHLYVASDPVGAEITLNGWKSGRITPSVFEDLAAGWYKIELESPTSKVQKTINVLPNDIARVSIPMKNNKQGSLLLETTPSGLNVILDGKKIGVSPQFIPAVNAGVHSVTVKGKVGGKKWSTNGERSVNVEAGRRNRFNINVVSGSEVPAEKSRAFNQKLDGRRSRASFQTRLSGGLDLVRAKAGFSGLAQVGVGTGRWFDIHTGVGFPGYIWVTDFELNVWPKGRFVPVLGLQVGAGFHPDYEYYSLTFYVGVELWMVDWLAAFVKLGVGGGWNLDTGRESVIVPGWVGIEARY